MTPKSLRSQIKEDIHCGHQGIKSTTESRRLREHVFWPWRNNERKENKETLMSHEIPDKPWQKIAADQFTFKNKEYLATVCYRSNFWEIDHLYNTKSSTVIKKLTAHLARYGIPKQLVTNNGPRFVSDEFRKFTESWGIQHAATSHHHSQANGKCEAAVKVAKRMLHKTTKSGEAEYLAMLNIRNVPTQGIDSSPAQRLLGRRTRTLLPTTLSLLKPRNPVSPHESVHLRSNQGRQAKYYNSRLLPNRSPVAWGSQRIALGALIFHSKTFHFIWWDPKFSAFSSEGPFNIFLGSSLELTALLATSQFLSLVILSA